MKYNISKPSLKLSKYVQNYWALDNCNPDNSDYIQRIIPNGLSELIFYFDCKPVSSDDNFSIEDNSIVNGQLSKYYDLKISGKISLFSILFKPNGLSVFLNLPLNELFNQNVPFRFVFKNIADELENKLFEAKTFNDRVIIAEKYLNLIFQKNEILYNHKRIDDSINIINQSKGLLNINELAERACYSRRQYERVFSQLIGASPKQFLKTIRLQNAIDIKTKNKKMNLTELTYNCGYYDQSHMINDFKELTGYSPREYFKESEPYSDYFL